MTLRIRQNDKWRNDSHWNERWQNDSKRNDRWRNDSQLNAELQAKSSLRSRPCFLSYDNDDDYDDDFCDDAQNGEDQSAASILLSRLPVIPYVCSISLKQTISLQCVS